MTANNSTNFLILDIENNILEVAETLKEAKRLAKKHKQTKIYFH